MILFAAIFAGEADYLSRASGGDPVEHSKMLVELRICPAQAGVILVLCYRQWYFSYLSRASGGDPSYLSIIDYKN